MENMIGTYRVKIFHFILKFVKDPELAEDLTQDILLKIWIRREKISSLADVDAYIFTMSKNHVMDHFNKLAREKIYQDEVWHLLQKAENRVESELILKDIQDQLDAMLKVLPPRQRQVFKLSLENELSLNEISDQLRIAPNTAKNHLSRALKVARSQMKPESFLLLIWVFLY